MFIINIFIHKKKKSKQIFDTVTVWFLQYCLELCNLNSPGQKIKACKTETDGRVVEGKHQSYTICAASAEERDSWIEAIRWGHSHTHHTHTLRLTHVFITNNVTSFSSLYFWHDVTNVLISSDFISKPEKLTSTQNRRNFPFDKMSSVPYFPWRTTKQKCHQNIRQTNIMILQSAGALIYLNLV